MANGYLNDTMTKLEIKNQLLLQECKLALDRIGSAHFRGFHSILFTLFTQKQHCHHHHLIRRHRHFSKKKSWFLNGRGFCKDGSAPDTDWWAPTSSIIHQTLPLGNVQWARLNGFCRKELDLIQNMSIMHHQCQWAWEMCSGLKS